MSLVFVSCENELVDKADAGGFSVSEAKNFYNKNAQRVYDDKGKTIDWENGIFHEFNGEKILEFPLEEKTSQIIYPVTPKTTLEEVNTVLDNILTRIVFVKNRKKIIIRELHYVPDLRYLESKNFEIGDQYFGMPNSDFKGLIVAEDFSDKFVRLTKIENSKVIDIWNPNIDNSNFKSKLLIFSKDGEPGMNYGPTETVTISNPRYPNYDFGPSWNGPRGGFGGQLGSGSADGSTPWGNDNNDVGGDGVGSGVNNSPVFFASTDPILNLTSFLRCINRNQSATLGVYSMQPIPNSSATHDGYLTGHSFVSIQQGNQTVVIGFYPLSNMSAIAGNYHGQYGNDSGAQFNVGSLTSLDSNELTNILNYINNHSNSTYDLDTYNCTDFAIAIANLAHLNVPDCYGTWPGGGGSNPGAFGQFLAGLNGTNSNSTVLHAPNTTTCP